MDRRGALIVVGVITAIGVMAIKRDEIKKEIEWNKFRKQKKNIKVDEIILD